MEITLGGDRLGSGNKTKVYAHNYERANFNLSRDWKSSMAPGVLTPCFVDFMQPFDTYEIDMQSLVKTLPTIAPLYGSFKLQVDFFRCPLRLYTGVLHNNPTGVGLKMKDVVFPKMELTKRVNNLLTKDTNPSSLLNYLGIRNIGSATNAKTYEETDIKRTFQAIPLLAYYDIFKNYYSNKQEKKAYVIGVNTDTITTNDYLEKVTIKNYILNLDQSRWKQKGETIIIKEEELKKFSRLNVWQAVNYDGGQNQNVIIEGEGLDIKNIEIDIDDQTKTLKDAELEGYIKIVDYTTTRIEFDTSISVFAKWKWALPFITHEITYNKTDEVKLNPFDIEDIDNMRNNLLGYTSIGDYATINESNDLPYRINFEQVFGEQRGARKNEYPLNGLCVKTYQSDLYNNWLDSETIEGENGIAALTAVDTTNGLSLDALNLAKKVYNLLNRIAVTGGTYSEWITATYGDDYLDKTETPVYEGGMSTEIVFDEVVSTAETSTEQGGSQPLGALAGRGFQLREQDKGGHVSIYSNEAAFIIAIASITPRIDYSQGNKWYLTELENMDDMHKPALDGIGFQNLMEEQMMGAAAYIDPNGTWHSRAVGKQPAWINYQTAISDVYGDFAEPNKAGFMILNRNYEMGIYKGFSPCISDLTTYIDPRKYNYAFADTTLTSQNFWTQLAFKVEKRSKMSAKVIPNL